MPQPSLFTHTLLAAALLSLNAGAIAQPPGAPTPGGPSALQRETRAELKANLEARFDKLDYNHDGKIDEKDAQARHEARQAERIAREFAEIDTDKNGSISKAEFAAAEEHRREEGPRFGPSHGPMGEHGRAMLFHRGPPDGRFMMRGRLPFAPPPPGREMRGFGRGGPESRPGEPITKAQFVDRGLARFDRVDTDHDGKISQAERDAARRDMRRGFHGRDPMPAPQQGSPKPGSKPEQ